MIAQAFMLFGFVTLLFSVIIAMVESRSNTNTVAPPIFFWISIAAFITALFVLLPW